MTMFQGAVKTYTLSINSPNIFTNYKNVIYLNGDFGLAFLYFVPEGGQLGANHKRAGENIFDIYYNMYSWAQFTDLLRNEKPVRFFYDDSSNTANVVTGDEPVGEGQKPLVG
jgi:hypothetical protein